MRYSSVILLCATLLYLAGCGTAGKRYKPVVRYASPSAKALQTILRGTYGDPYRYAGQGPNRFDCSGLVYYSYASMNLWLPRTARDQSRRGRTIPVSDLRYGDLIFFDTHRPYRGRVNHVGIYIGGGRFLHASSSKGRVVSGKLNSPFYRRRIIVCKRLMHDPRNPDGWRSSSPNRRSDSTPSRSPAPYELRPAGKTRSDTPPPKHEDGQLV